MINDEKSQPINILDVVQGDSYTETISNIIDLSHGNETLKDLLLRGFYQNPKKEIHHKLNSILNNLINSRNKSNRQCEHDGCNNPSAYSHELSESSALSSLADNENKAYILKRNFKHNSFEFIFDRVHIRNILNFSGYCDEHDQCLFEILDQPGREIDSEYVNLQALRMMRQHKLNHSIALTLYKEMASELQLLIKEITDAEQDATELQEEADSFDEKIKYNETSLNELCAFYDKLLAGIKSKEYIIDYVKLPCFNLGWVFSQSIELISEKSNDYIFSFIFKIDINGQPSLIHAWEKTDHINKYDDFCFDINDIVKCMLLNKEKLAFSAAFLNSISSTYLELFILDEDIYNNVNNPMFLLLFKKILLGQFEDD